MIIAMAADPSALRLKEALKAHLETKGHTVSDWGTTEAREVPFFTAAQNACGVIQKGKAERGILLCGSGMGMAIVAGKQSGITAACVESVYAARMCRAINDANVLCLGAMIWGEAMAKEAVDVFLGTAHTEGLSHIREALITSADEVRKIDERTRK
jgi:ribose 5-phosphate isomerase B